MSETWTPQYEKWRHGGWYVVNIRYPSGACGCVTNNTPDRKWRIACDRRRGDHTFPTRDAAARAERMLAPFYCKCGTWPERDDKYCAMCGSELKPDRAVFTADEAR